MILHCSHPNGWRLHELDNFRAFKVVFDGVEPREAPRHDGITLDGETHAWVKPAVPAQLAGDGATPEWLESFDRMVAFAAKQGWVRSDGAIRVHIER